MAEATNIACNKVMVFMDGSEMFELTCVVSTGETVTIPTTGDGSSVVAATRVSTVAINGTGNGQGGGGSDSATYSSANRRWTFKTIGTDVPVRILFKAGGINPV